jgi:hypothetical protein
MKITECEVGSAIYWRIRQNDPDVLPLSGLPGASLLNPLLYDQLPGRDGREREQARVLWLKDDAWFQTRSIVLTDTARDDTRFGQRSFRFVSDLLAHIRLHSGQATIPKSPILAATAPGEFVVPRRPAPIRGVQWTIVGHLIDWAVTLDVVTKADREVNDPIPLPNGILLDGIEASAEADHRRALLYLGIAAESVAATALDRQYAKDQESTNPNLRFRSYPTGGGQEEYKDAVYKWLRDQGKFASTLHELPLYLLNRSLAHEDQALYQRALRLYRTRNKLAHMGDAPEADGYLPLTHAGVSEGLETAVAIFRWFGENVTFVNPLRSRLVQSKEFE